MKYAKEDLPYYKKVLLKAQIIELDKLELGAQIINCFIYSRNTKEILAEKTVFKIKTTIEYFESRMKTLEIQMDMTHQEAYTAFKKKVVNQAKIYLRREKMIKERYNELADKKYTLEDQLFKLESASSSKDLVNIMKLINATQNEIKLNVDEVFDLKEDIKAGDKEREEINQMFSVDNQEKSEMDEEMKRLENEVFNEQLKDINRTPLSNIMQIEDPREIPNKVNLTNQNVNLEKSTEFKEKDIDPIQRELNKLLD